MSSDAPGRSPYFQSSTGPDKLPATENKVETQEVVAAVENKDPQNEFTKKFTEEEWKGVRVLRVRLAFVSHINAVQLPLTWPSVEAF